MHTVFVYGTLKAGEPNHYYLTSKNNGYAKFLGEARTQEKYPLVIGTQYNIPFLLLKPGDGNIIKGEVYEVDEKMLLILDELENHPEYYTRDLYTVTLKKENSEEEENIECWIYFIKTFNEILLSKEKYSCYSSRGSHNLPYLERSKRDPIYMTKWQNDYLK